MSRLFELLQIVYSFYDKFNVVNVRNKDLSNKKCTNFAYI